MRKSKKKQQERGVQGEKTNGPVETLNHTKESGISQDCVEIPKSPGLEQVADQISTLNLDSLESVQGSSCLQELEKANETLPPDSQVSNNTAIDPSHSEDAQSVLPMRAEAAKKRELEMTWFTWT